MGNVNMEAYQINYRNNSKPSVHTVDAALDALNTSNASITQDIIDLTAAMTAKADKIDIAPTFSAETTYFEGDMVFQSGRLWKFTTNHDPGEWNQEEVAVTNIDMAIKAGGGGGLKYYSESYVGTGELVNTLHFEHEPKFILAVERADHQIVLSAFYPYAAASRLYYLTPTFGSSDIRVTNTNGVITIAGSDVAASCNTLNENYNLVYLA